MWARELRDAYCQLPFVMNDLPSGVVDVLIARRRVESCRCIVVALITRRVIDGRVGVQASAATSMCIC